ncbi:MAG TPA: LIC12162 family protein [Vicinamibacterales bacterium]|nr:LIC12162 family protein [Vicinamibacterales bacterium]
MFLATTACGEVWDEADDLVLLGSWCLKGDSRAALEGRRVELMPSPWNDRRRFHAAAADADRASERILATLADALNAAHGVSRSLRYWRILIGPWVLHFVHSIFDRYEHLRVAFDRYASLTTNVLQSSSFVTPLDIQEGLQWLAHSDTYNLQLYSQILEATGYTFPARALRSADPTDEAPVPARVRLTGSRWPRQALASLARRVAALVCPSDAVLVFDVTLSRRQLWALALESRLRLMPMPLPDSRRRRLEDESAHPAREALATLPAAGPFDAVCLRLLPQNLPTVYLEGFAQMRAHYAPPAPACSAILAETMWLDHEPFKMMAAEMAERGTPLAVLQHGGGYGMLRDMPLEQHDARFADRYFVWGWANDASQPLRNLPHPFVGHVPRRRPGRRRPTRTRVLFVAQELPRYHYRFHSIPAAGNQWQAELGGYYRFLASSTRRMRSAITVRLHPIDCGHNLRECLASRFDDVTVDDTSTFEHSLREARVAIVTSISTSLLELMAANVPTVMFWDRGRWEVRDEVVADLQTLRDIGVLWDAPEAAATKLAEVYEDAEAWWQGRMIQDARRAFVDRFALCQTDWRHQWTTALTDELRSPVAEGARHV